MSTNNSLENILYEGDDEMGIFNIFGSKDKGIARAGEHLEDPSRREAIETIGKVGLVAGAALTGISSKVNAEGFDVIHWEKSIPGILEFSKKIFPPGINLCLKDLNKNKQYKDVNLIYEAYRFGVMDAQEDGRYAFQNIWEKLKYCDDNTIYTQPAWWYIANVLPEDDKRFHLNIEDKKKILKNKNESLSDFEVGIRYYFGSWNIPWTGEKKMYRNKKRIELSLLYSLFEASNIYYSKDEYIKLNNKLKQSGLNEDYFDLNNLNVNVEKYVNLDLQRKQIVMEQIRDNLLGADYNKQLIASWSDFFLISHYQNIERKNGELTMLHYNTIEQPLKKAMGGIFIRGPPRYNLNS